MAAREGHGRLRQEGRPHRRRGHGLCRRHRRRGRGGRGQCRDRLRGQEREVCEFRQGRGRHCGQGEPRRPGRSDGVQVRRHRHDCHPAAAGDGAGDRREHQGPPVRPLCRRRLRSLCPRRRQDRRAGEPGDRSARREGGGDRQGRGHADRRSEPPLLGQVPGGPGRPGRGEEDHDGPDGERSQDGLQARGRAGEDRPGQAEQVLLRELPAAAGVREGRLHVCGEVYRVLRQGAGR